MDAEQRLTSLNTRRVVMGLVLGLGFLRVLLVLSSTLEGLQGYGDFYHFFNLAEIPGWPYFNHWSEFPPLFPFLIEILYQIAGGTRHVFVYLLFILVSAADIANLIIFARLIDRVWGEGKELWRLAAYGVVLAGLAYAWWYFDSFAVLTLLLGLCWILEGKAGRAGVALGVGGLIKFFPLVVLAAAWKHLGWKKALQTSLIALVAIGAVYGSLWLASPQFTQASLVSQGAKGSWETVWAMIDGNYQTGNFGPLVERLDPATAWTARGTPAKIPPVIVLIAAAGIGFWRFLKARKESARSLAALTGLAWTILALWSPGWSPQWVLYLLPLMLLTLDGRQAVLMTVIFTLVNLMEWPLLLSRGMFYTLPLTIGLRTILFIMLAVIFDQIAAKRPAQPTGSR